MVLQGGMEIGPEKKWMLFPDIGYSFCNCRNIFYTSHIQVNNPIEELKSRFDELDISNEYHITVPDPYFVKWNENPYDFKYWKPREHFVIWDIDSLCEVIEECGYKIIGRNREFGVDAKLPQTSTIIFGKEELIPRASVACIMSKYKMNIVAAEVGTHTGRNAEKMLKYLDIKELHLIDFWEAYSDYPDSRNQSQDFEMVKNKFRGNDKVKIIKSDSSKAAERFADKTFDFVYIDADHSYEGVKKDIVAWLPKVAYGGIIAGHDYGYKDTGVKTAVDEIFEKKVKTGFNGDKITDWWVEL